MTETTLCNPSNPLSPHLLRQMFIAGDQPMDVVSLMCWYHIIHWQRLFSYHYFGFLYSTPTPAFMKFAEHHLPFFKIRVKVEN